MKFTRAALSLACCLTLVSGALANGLQITEVYIGLDGADGTEDFVEVSNLGGGTISLGGLFYDDASLDITAGGDLPDIELESGESAVFLVNVDAGDEADAIADFEALFGAIDNLFTLPDGGLSSGGDTAAILDSAGNVISSFTYEEEDTIVFANSPTLVGTVPNGSGGFIGFGATFEDLTGANNTPGNLVFSTEGVNGAVATPTFPTDSPIFGGTEAIEDDPATPEDETVLEVLVPVFFVGSPGFVPASAVVPEPSTGAFAVLTLVGMAARRRRWSVS